MSDYPTLDELRSLRDRGFFGHSPSRFHKSPCPKCGAMVTNQAMGRKAHMNMHKRKPLPPPVPSK